MSTGFRLFLLILFGFGAVYAYRFRSVEIHRWLRAEPVEPELDPRLGIVSPVDRVLDSDVSWAWLLGSARAASAGDLEPQSETELPVDELPPLADEEIHEDAADLPVSDDLPGAEAIADASEETLGESTQPQGGEGISGVVERTYKVEAGDSLWKIAARQLGSGHRYRDILAWNKELFTRVNPDVLPAGTELRIQLPAGAEILKTPRAEADTPVAERSGQRAAAPVERPRRRSNIESGVAPRHRGQVLDPR